MRKKLLVGIICLTTLFSGCGNNTKTIEGDVAVKENGGTAGTAGGAKESDAPGGPDVSGAGADGSPDGSGAGADSSTDGFGHGAGADSDASGPAAEYKGYTFVYNGVAIGMDADAAPVVEQLGEPASYFEAPSCAFEGIDKLYTYNSFELDTYPTGDKDYVSTVILKDDTITTPEGIGIGSTVAQMEEAYGTDWSDVDGMAVYEKDGMKLCFILDGDSIISVEYRSTAIDG